MLSAILQRTIERVQGNTFSLNISARLYRLFRLICCLFEQKDSGVSYRAGFKVSIAWTEDLGFDREDA